MRRVGISWIKYGGENFFIVNNVNSWNTPRMSGQHQFTHGLSYHIQQWSIFCFFQWIHCEINFFYWKLVISQENSRRKAGLSRDSIFCVSHLLATPRPAKKTTQKVFQLFSFHLLTSSQVQIFTTILIRAKTKLSQKFFSSFSRKLQLFWKTKPGFMSSSWSRLCPLQCFLLISHLNGQCLTVRKVSDQSGDSTEPHGATGHTFDTKMSHFSFWALKFWKYVS